MTQAGFWRNLQQDNRRITIGQYGQVNRVWFLAPQGAGGPFGGFAMPPAGVFSTFAALKPNLRSRDVIYLVGVLREQAVAPDDVYDVLMVGAADTPRQATDSGEPTGGGATWMAPASGAVAATPLLEVVRQGWTFMNIAFNPHTNSAALRFTTAGGLDEAGQACIDGCLFTGGGTGQIGIEDNGGSGMLQVVNSVFRNLSGTAILGLTTANAVPSYWQIKNNLFGQNTNDIKMSLAYANIDGNTFQTPGAGATNKVISTIALSGQGSNNAVTNNFFNDVAAGVISTEGYVGSATDHWMNFASDAVKFGFA
ncbi:MAG: hypothetical protein ABWY25_00470 [Paenisporosarcina sp.]